MKPLGRECLAKWRYSSIIFWNIVSSFYCSSEIIDNNETSSGREGLELFYYSVLVDKDKYSDITCIWSIKITKYILKIIETDSEI